MKWLTTFLCLLVTSLAFAEEPTIPEAQPPARQIIALPFMMQCSPVPPDTMLLENYQELGFLEGDAKVFRPDMNTIGGKLRMFLRPDKPNSFTIMLELTPEVHCMVMSGENLGPMIHPEDAI